MAPDIHPHLSTLHTKHRELDAAVQAEQARPLPDGMRLAALKRAKLAAKDAMRAFQSKIASTPPSSTA